MKKLFLLTTIIFLAASVNAKVWRVNNTPGVLADFIDMPTAMASALVLNDDTIHVEASVTSYAGFRLTKRLVIIGTGYFLSGANSNVGLQANTNSAKFAGSVIEFDSTGSASTIIGLDNFFMGIGQSLGSATDNITITRCNFTGVGLNYGFTPNTKMTGWKINKCHITSTLGSGSLVLQNWEVINNIFTGSMDMTNTNNLNNLVRNNVFRSGMSLYSAYFANNIIINTTFTATNVTVKNNTCISTAPAGFAPFVGVNGNVANETDANIFQGISSNSTDGQWRLKVGSQAIGTGETVSAITPDRGAFGTADPYVLSGIPSIPTIYLLTVPAAVASNATTMPITISTKSNN
jgi:hypothetical protein